MIYRVGIVGSGFGVRAHLPAFAAHPNFEVVAIASPNSAERIAKERRIPQSFSSCAEMLASAQIDVVSVTSPPFSHREDVLASLSARKHVICEKPFAMNVREAEEMLEASKATKTATAVMHEFRWVPQRTAIKEMIDNDHLRPMREIEITQFSRMLRGDQTERRRGWWFQRDCGGGMAGAALSHVVDTANWFAGRPPLTTTGLLRNAHPVRHDDEGEFESSVDDGAFAVLDYGDGLVARLTVDGTVAVESATYAVHAENRTAVASGSNPYEMRLFSVDEEETAELDCKPSPYQKYESVDPLVPLIMQLLDEFVKQIETGESAVPTFSEAVATQRVLEAIGYGR
ncbi:MAG TPA: Gfo/Idh/MocA family oxidoreductase [Candidatus Baltobacteraceae bacterium]|jgi:predicted dehydrogenase|nr:Gfo/Idh/MocA family oxidoreductase [Candidatus Baltobacteraceae bacterium]